VIGGVALAAIIIIALIASLGPGENPSGNEGNPVIEPGQETCNFNGIINAGEECDANQDLSVIDFCIKTVQGCTMENYSSKTFVGDAQCAVAKKEDASAQITSVDLTNVALAGKPGCTNECRFDFTKCTTCGNSTCESGKNNAMHGYPTDEDNANCPYDCPPGEK